MEITTKNILLIDFDDGLLLPESLMLKADKHIRKTLWCGGTQDRLIDKNTNYDFIFGNPHSFDKNYPQSHQIDGAHLAECVEKGASFILFNEVIDTYAIHNLAGHNFSIENLDSSFEPINVRTTNFGVFFELFDKFSHNIDTTVTFQFRETLPENCVLQLDLDYDKYIQIIAVHINPIEYCSFFKRSGKGYYLYLPSFGKHNLDVITYIIQDLSKKIFKEQGVDDSFAWLSNYRLLFPKSKLLHDSINKEKSQHNEEMKRLKRDYDYSITNEQEEYGKLITEKGDALKEVVKNVLNTELELEVLDIDENEVEKLELVKPINNARSKEDLWVAKEELTNPEEQCFFVCEVSGHDTGSCPPKKYGQFQSNTVRCIREFKNTKIRGLLLFNHSRMKNPYERSDAFGIDAVTEATDAEHVLLSSFELFRVIRELKQDQPKFTKEQFITYLFNFKGGELKVFDKDEKLLNNFSDFVEETRE